MLDLPEAPFLSDLDPDLFGILVRNLMANALSHGTPGGPVMVRLERRGALVVENDCAPLAPEELARIGARFERGTMRAAGPDGAGLGVAIVRAIVTRAGGALDLASPIPGGGRGFRACARFQAELRGGAALRD